MKKTVSIILVSIICCMCFCGCNGVDSKYCGKWKATKSEYDSFASQNVTRTEIITLNKSGTVEWKSYKDLEYLVEHDSEYGDVSGNVSGKWYVKSGYIYLEFLGVTRAFEIKDKNTLIPETDNWGDSFKRIK